LGRIPGRKGRFWRLAARPYEKGNKPKNGKTDGLQPLASRRREVGAITGFVSKR
jgi:hypothetical protein